MNSTEQYSKNWPSVVMSIEKYLITNPIPRTSNKETVIDSEVNCFFMNLRMTTIINESDSEITLAYSDELIYRPESTKIIENILEVAFQNLFNAKYLFHIIPIGEILDKLLEDEKKSRLNNVPKNDL